MSEQSAEEKELGLVGKVELRIAIAASDQKLEAILNTYLAPLLLKLASEFAAVRNKVSCLALIREKRLFDGDRIALRYTS